MIFPPATWNGTCTEPVVFAILPIELGLLRLQHAYV